MKRLSLIGIVVSLLAFVVNPVVILAVPVKLPSGKTVEVTQAQIEALKKQPGIQYSNTLPTSLPEGKIAVAIPKELGGGYLIGTPEAIASGFNAVGVTVGLTAAEVGGVTAAITGAVLGATLAAIIAAALASQGEEEVAPSHHEEAPSHHEVAPSHHEVAPSHHGAASHH